MLHQHHLNWTSAYYARHLLDRPLYLSSSWHPNYLINNKRIITILHSETATKDVDKLWQFSNSNTKCCTLRPLTHLLASWPYSQGQLVPSLPLHFTVRPVSTKCSKKYTHIHRKNTPWGLCGMVETFNNGQARKYRRTIRFSRLKDSKVQETTCNLERKSEHNSESTYSKQPTVFPSAPCHRQFVSPVYPLH